VQSMYQKAFFWICLLFLCIAWNLTVSGTSNAAFDEKSKETIINGVLKKNLLIMPQLNKLNFGFGRQKGIEYLYRKTVSKLFFQDKKLEARVIDVIIESPDITLELSHPIFGTGTIKFFFSQELLEQTPVEGIQKILLETLGDENHQYVFSDPQSKLYYLWSCNHLSDPSLSARMRLEDAEAQGYRASGFCFTKMLYIPNFSVEVALEREWTQRLRNYEPIEKSSKKQALLNEVGKKVLQNWPIKQIGYNYAFHLSESRRIDAFAIPTGKIIITTALFDSLANPDELEALLVYAIAHVERRHSLKEYYACLEEEAYADTMKKLAAVAGSLAGPASGVISGALTATLPEASCNPQSLGGYQNEYVREADAMAAFYFDAHGKDKGAIVSLLKKLQFSDLAEKLHPDQDLTRAAEVSYNDRIKRVENIRFVYFKKGSNFILKREGKPPVQLDLIYQRSYKKENKLLVYVDEKNLLPLNQDAGDEMITGLSVKDKNGKHRFELNDQSLTEDVWGAYLTFEASAPQRQKFLQDIEKVVLSVAPAKAPHDRESIAPEDKLIKRSSGLLYDQTARDYTFVPGTIDW
jgi:hypothetical protein